MDSHRVSCTVRSPTLKIGNAGYKHHVTIILMPSTPAASGRLAYAEPSLCPGSNAASPQHSYKSVLLEFTILAMNFAGLSFGLEHTPVYFTLFFLISHYDAYVVRQRMHWLPFYCGPGL